MTTNTGDTQRRYAETTSTHQLDLLDALATKSDGDEPTIRETNPETYRDATGQIIAPRLVAFIAAETPTTTIGNRIHTHGPNGYTLAEDEIKARLFELAGDQWTRALEGEVLHGIRVSSPPMPTTHETETTT